MRLLIDVSTSATLREARPSTHPDPVWVASVAELAGAHGIAAHLRDDQRFIKERDVRLLRETVSCSFNLQIAPSVALIEIAQAIRPDWVTLLPEGFDEDTDACLDLEDKGLKGAVQRFHDAGISVSGLVPADRDIVGKAKELGFDGLQLNASALGVARGAEADIYMQRLANAAKAGARVGLSASAGGRIELGHLRRVSAVPGLEEVRLGHAIVARALFVGMAQAVRDALALLVS